MSEVTGYDACREGVCKHFGLQSRAKEKDEALGELLSPVDAAGLPDTVTSWFEDLKIAKGRVIDLEEASAIASQVRRSTTKTERDSVWGQLLNKLKVSILASKARASQARASQPRGKSPDPV